jgi:hypothetical protein
VNETSQIRLENISAQRREIEDLREQVDGGKPASPKLGGASDSQVNDLIKTIGLYFKVHNARTHARTHAHQRALD